MKAALNTPRALIHWGAAEFDRSGLVFEHGTDNAMDEAAWLVLHALGIGYDQPDQDLDAVLDAVQCQRVLVRLLAYAPRLGLLTETYRLIRTM